MNCEVVFEAENVRVNRVEKSWLDYDTYTVETRDKTAFGISWTQDDFFDTEEKAVEHAESLGHEVSEVW